MSAEELVAEHEVLQLAKELYGEAEGSHVTPSEVAVTQFVYPDAIKSALLDPPVAPRGEFADAADYRRNFPDGRIGSNPGLATPGAGRRLYDAAVAVLTKDCLGWGGRVNARGSTAYRMLLSDGRPDRGDLPSLGQDGSGTCRARVRLASHLS